MRRSTGGANFRLSSTQKKTEQEKKEKKKREHINIETQPDSEWIGRDMILRQARELLPSALAGYSKVVQVVCRDAIIGVLIKSRIDVGINPLPMRSGANDVTRRGDDLGLACPRM